MRKIFTLLLLLAGLHGMGQQFNNEWIDFSRTYYKVKVARTGLYRIPKTVLDANGIGAADVRNYEIYRNGEKVFFHAPVASGQLPSNGYLEFWGEKNDGKPDKALYLDPAYQHTDYWSLQTDTAVYFISVRNTPSGGLYNEVVNNVAGSSLTPETDFLYTYGYYAMKSNFFPSPGLAAVVGAFVYSSSYDRGEIHISNDIGNGGTLAVNSQALYINTSSPVTPVLKFGAVGTRNNSRSVKLRVNGTELADQTMNYFNDLIYSVNVPSSVLSSGVANMEFQNTSIIPDDRMGVSFAELTYSRLFDFGGAKNFKFVLPAKSGGYLLKITNFNNAGLPPVLYDMTNGERYTGDLSVPGTVQFALPGTANERKLVLVAEDAANITTVTEATPRTFVNYELAANQAEYLIITDPVLYKGTSGNNPVMDYKNYRSSPAGGGYVTSIADVNELVDQFAFGIKKHPLSVHNYLRFARRKFPRAPKFCFLIGRGMTYYEYSRALRRQSITPMGDQLNLVPTWGHPASDNLLSADDLQVPVATTPIGRLSVVLPSEIEVYLAKIKEYEAAQKAAPNTLEGRAWMKNVVHVTGSSDAYLGTVLCNYMNVYKQLIEDTAYGGRVTTFCKESTNPVEQLTSERLSGLFAEGISFLTYFGHSSSTTLEFNIDNPQAYNNPGKYPVFFVNGCNAGNFFTYFDQRYVANETLSEKFVLAPQRGSIAFLASTSYGIVNYLHLYLRNLYNVMGHRDFNRSLGESYRDAMSQMWQGVTVESDKFYVRLHAEQMAMNGDPAIYLNAQLKPDYVIEPQSLVINPSFISLAENFYSLKIRMTNVGRAVADSITLEVKQTYPDGSVGMVYRKKVAGTRSVDSLTLEVPIVATRDKGQSKVTVTIDADNDVVEIDENNNTAVREFYIYEDEARPAYPPNYSIIDNPNQKLFASTANPLSAVKTFLLEIDTTKAFNSTSKVSKSITSAGGLLEFNTDLTYKDSTVYYWRAAPVPVSGEPQWSDFSFTYMKNTDGWNQSHFWQHQNSQYERMYLDSASRQFKFGISKNGIFVQNCIYDGNYSTQLCTEENEFTVHINGDNRIASACVGNSLIFNVLDSVTLKPWRNVDANGNNLYRFGSGSANCAPTRNYNFEFSYVDPANRKLMMDFMDSVPVGNFVIVRSVDAAIPYSYAPYWRNDTTLYGSNKSLYHSLLAAGFTDIDSLNQQRSWILVYKKGAGSTFVPQFAWGKSFSSKTKVSVTVTTPDTLGFITSPAFGPAKKWKEVKWDGISSEDPSADNPSIDVIGVDKANATTILYTLDKDTRSFDLSAIDPQQYPYLRLKMRNADSVNLTPYQLKYWRILYDPVPEGAVAPNLFLISKDTVELGEKLQFGLAFKNISKVNFDSLFVRATLVDRNNVSHNLPLSKFKPLVVGDTVRIVVDIDTKAYPGNNTLNLYVNPEFDQPEYQLFNNFVFKSFYVNTDQTNPTLDVTFDGVRILNRDIVSAKPHIQIRLKDDSKFLLLNDTTVSSIEIKDPKGNVRVYHYDGDTLRFVPATSGADNSATIDFTPVFTDQINPEGDDYELIVKAKDRSGNATGTTAYRVTFRIITKSMISNLLNYPNPFSTSTAFVFTLTGSEIPQNIRIQVLTVTGKIVREITMNELGPLRIGRNITEFKWDGTDQYGSKLANGVYLYRVVTSMNGKTMEKYKAREDTSEKYFNNGYGKMYIMR